MKMLIASSGHFLIVVAMGLLLVVGSSVHGDPTVDPDPSSAKPDPGPTTPPVTNSSTAGPTIVPSVKPTTDPSPKPPEPTTTTTTPAPTTPTAAPTTTTTPAPTPVEIHKHAIEFLRRGFNIFAQRLYETYLEKPIKNKPIFKDDKDGTEKCWDLLTVPSFIGKCEKFLYKQNKTNIRTTYNETEFRDLLEADQSSVYAPYGYIDTLNLTSQYGRVYADSVFQVDDTRVDVVTSVDEMKKAFDDEFVKSVNQLSKDDADVNAFINEYGTHYFTYATFGGNLRIVDFIEEETYEYYGKEEAHDFLLAFLYQFFGFNGKKHVPVDWKWAKASQVIVRGGNESMELVEGHAIDWYVTVGTDNLPLAINNGSIVPLKDLFNLTITDETDLKKAVKKFEDAIAIQQAKYYLQALVDGMKIAQNDRVVGKLHGCFDSKLLGAYFESVFKEVDPRETMASDVFKERESCALFDTNYVAMMRAFLPKPAPPGQIFKSP